MMPSFSWLIGLPRKPSKIFKTSLPPSNPGIGNKLKIPKLIEIIAIIAITVVTPCDAAWEDSWKIATGPPNLLISGWAIKLPTALKITSELSMVVCKPPSKISPIPVFKEAVIPKKPIVVSPDSWLSGVAVKSSVSDPRLTARAIWVSGYFWISVVNSDQLETSTPSTAKISSPFCSPASAAGVPASIPVTMVASWFATPPCANTNPVNKTKDKIKLFIGPAKFVSIRCQSFADWNWTSLGAIRTSTPSSWMIVASWSTAYVIASCSLPLMNPVIVNFSSKSKSVTSIGIACGNWIFLLVLILITLPVASWTKETGIPGVNSVSSSPQPAIWTYPPNGSIRIV